MKKIGSILFMSIVVLLLAGAMFVLSLMKRPLGPSLALDVPPTKPSVAKAVQPAAGQPQSQKTCGNKGQMSILVIGQGKVEDQNVYRTGSIRLVVVDFDQPKVSILAMPAELYVDAKVLKDPAIPNDKLDFIYHETFMKAGNVPEDVAHVKGTQATAQAIIDNFGFVPDHYVTVLQEPFVELVDTLGGIDVDLPTALPSKDPDYDFLAGEQTLSGMRTLNLTRYDPDDQPNDVWGRFEHQDIVLRGLLDAIKKPDNWTKAPELLKLARKMILTDMSVDQLNDLKCMVEQVGSEAVHLDVSEDMIDPDDKGNWVPKYEEIKGLIQQMYAQ